MYYAYIIFFVDVLLTNKGKTMILKDMMSTLWMKYFW
jgi:hypothetical protein